MSRRLTIKTYRQGNTANDTQTKDISDGIAHYGKKEKKG
jgi:hypothetical protein